MIVMPLFHVAGVNVSCAGLAHGCRTIIVRDFVPARALEIMQDAAVAHTFIAPAMILMLLQSPGIAETDFSTLRTIAYGASPISEEVLNRAKAAFGCGFVQYYGMTETTGGGTYLSPADHGRVDKLRSCGRPWPDTEAAILGPDGAPVAQGEVGEIAIRWRLRDEGLLEPPRGHRRGDPARLDADRRRQLPGRRRLFSPSTTG